jgi:large subunit ribosomal protein L10
MTELRRRLRGAGVEYVVVKNTLAQRAFAANGVHALDEHLAGPTGLVLSGTDAMAGAKVLTTFAKEFEKPAIKIGLVDGRPVTPEQVRRLADLPPREVLLAQLAGYIQAPMAQFAGVMNGLLSQMVGALEALRAQRSAAS